MDPAEYRRCGHEMVDLIADYYENIESRPVLSTVSPGYISELVPSTCPEEPESFSDVKADIERVIMPGVTHWQSPNFFAFFPAISSFPSQLGDMLSGAINCIGFNWLNSPACTELETVVLDWLAKLCALPEAFLSNSNGGGVIQGTASEATLVAMIAARDKIRLPASSEEPSSDASSTAPSSDDVGVGNVKNYVAYGSTQTHSSLAKATMILACAHGEIPCVPGTGSMDPQALDAAIVKDKGEGKVPYIVVATIGTTSTAAMDDLIAIGEVCKKHDLWLHVDGAYAGAALVCPEFRDMAKGMDFADSFVFNCHKWMLVNFDLSALWVRERKHLVNALSITPVYMRNKATESGLVCDYRDWQVPLGRRFRSLKLWFVLRMYGANGIRSHIREHVRLAQVFESHLTKDERFELACPVSLSLVCFRLKDMPSEDTVALKDSINAAGKIFLIGSEFEGKAIIRFVPVSERVKDEHVVEAWKHIQEVTTTFLEEKAKK